MDRAIVKEKGLFGSLLALTVLQVELLSAIY